jgi:hypothetical protein
VLVCVVDHAASAPTSACAKASASSSLCADEIAAGMRPCLDPCRAGIDERPWPVAGGRDDGARGVGVGEIPPGGRLLSRTVDGEPLARSRRWNAWTWPCAAATRTDRPPRVLPLAVKWVYVRRMPAVAASRAPSAVTASIRTGGMGTPVERGDELAEPTRVNSRGRHTGWVAVPGGDNRCRSSATLRLR